MIHSNESIKHTDRKRNINAHKFVIQRARRWKQQLRIMALMK